MGLSISEITKKFNCTENKIWACRLKIESYDLGKVWLQNTETWLNKIARRKNIPVRSRLIPKFLRLKHERKMMRDQLNKIKAERISNANIQCHKNLYIITAVHQYRRMMKICFSRRNEPCSSRPPESPAVLYKNSKFGKKSYIRF